MLRWCLVFALMCSPASAAMLAIDNPSFEDDVLALEGFTVNAVSGWSVLSATSGAFRPTAAQFNPGGVAGSALVGAPNVPDGVNTLFLNNSDGGSVEQTLTDTLTGVAGSQYDLTFWVGRRFDNNFGSYGVILLAGGQVLGAVSGGGGGPIPGVGEFAMGTLSYTTTGSELVVGQPLRIQLNAGAGSGGQINFDDIQLEFTSAVPEPSSVGLLALGLAAAWAYRRRRR